MSPDKVKKLKALEKENAQLKKLVANLSLDNAILKEAPEGSNVPLQPYFASVCPATSL